LKLGNDARKIGGGHDKGDHRMTKWKEKRKRKTKVTPEETFLYRYKYHFAESVKMGNKNPVVTW
jgi:hypothetical protein